MAAAGSTGHAEFASIRATARRLRVRDRLLSAAVKNGELEGHLLGSRAVRLYWPAVIAWVRSKQVRPTPHAQARLAEVLEREGRAGIVP